MKTMLIRPYQSTAASCGMTLIELMIALAIMSILGIMSYRAISMATENGQRLASENRRWHDVVRFFRMAESDLLQIVARPVSDGQVMQPSLLVTPATTSAPAALSFLRLDGANNSVQRRSYRQEGNAVVLLQWPGVDDSSTPIKYRVLDDVKTMRINVITQNGQNMDTWPTNSVNEMLLPAAIDIELELTDAGTIHRLFSLR